MFSWHLPQPNLHVSAESTCPPATPDRSSPLLALWIASTLLTSAWSQPAANAKGKAAEPARFTVATRPPETENAYCAKGNIANFGEKDGPAELPKTCYYTGLDGTPSPGKQIRVGPNADLSEAVDGAKCGDTLLLPAGATFPIKEFPRKNCDDRHYITVRTDTPDSKLPPEDARISPAWGGFASLPGRPAYGQPAGGAAKLLATLAVKPETGVEFGDHYRFIGIEWAPVAGKKIARLLFTNGGDHLIFDRNWVHGIDGVELGHGLGIKGSVYIAVIHSYFNSFTCTAGKGSCTDATAIGGGNGEQPTHTLKIVDNFLESSGQNVFFGGAAATVRPEDIEIRHNYLFKPMFWNRNSPEHKEPTPIVKNLFEIKSARHVLFEGNYLENSWGGFSQVGPAIVLTPRNISTKEGGDTICGECPVTDITIRYIWVRKVNQVLQIATPVDKGRPTPANSFSIHDLVAEGLLYPECVQGCGGALNHLSGPVGGSPKESVLHDITIDHITFISMRRTKDLAILGGAPANDPSASQMSNINWTNTISDVGQFGLWPLGGGPEQNCSSFKGATPKTRLEACWKGSSAFRGNVLAGGGSIRGQLPDWPDGNFITDGLDTVGFVKLNGGLDGDYHLTPSSKFKGKATDGRDPGADVDLVLAAIKGVR